MATREEDLIQDAIASTEKEIWSEAWGQEPDAADETGDRSLETMGDGLEGQHEPDDEAPDDAPDADEEAADDADSDDEQETEEDDGETEDGDAEEAEQAEEGE